MRLPTLILGTLLLACGGLGAPDDPPTAPDERRTAPDELPTPGAPNPCPDGLLPNAEEQDGGLVLCEGKDGSIAFLRHGNIVLRGALGGKYGTDRIGRWIAFDSDGKIRAEGNYDGDGNPTGEWMFPDGKRTWKDGHWEPPSPMVTLLWYGRTSAEDWTIELLDADLAKERVAIRRIATSTCPNCDEPIPPCNYPGLASGMAGATLQLLQPGVGDPIASWVVYRMPGNGDCSTDAEAAPILAAAKEEIAGAGLDVTKRPALIPAEETKGSNGIAPGEWSYPVPDHTVTLKEIPRPGVDVELTVPDLALRDWTYDSAGGDRTFFYELAVDGHPAWRFVYANTTGCAGGGTMRPEGLIVQGDRAALVLTGVWTSCDGATYRTVVSPVVSLTAPKAPAF